MLKQQKMVQKFHEIFKHPVCNTPTMIKSERANARADWMREEIEEFLEAKDIVEQADAMGDLLYFCLGSCVEMGVDIEPIFEIIQQSNMNKIWSDGTVHYRESDGKVAKPEGWQAPEPQIEAEIKRQMI